MGPIKHVWELAAEKAIGKACYCLGCLPHLNVYDASHTQRLLGMLETSFCCDSGRAGAVAAHNKLLLECSAQEARLPGHGVAALCCALLLEAAVGNGEEC